jgi:hypothetical protein
LFEKLKRFDFHLNWAIADEAPVAALMAMSSSSLRWVPPGQGTSALSSIPISVLGFDEVSLRWFEALGIQTVGELRRPPWSDLRRRISISTWNTLRWLEDGLSQTVLDWFVPPERLEAQVELEDSVENLEPLLFVFKSLVDRLCARLETRGEVLASLRASVKYDLKPAQEAHWKAVFPAPLRDSKSILNVLRLKLQEQPLSAPVREVSLKFEQTAKKPPQMLHLWSTETASVQALPRLVAELTAELGTQCVGSLTVTDHHVPFLRSVLGDPFASSKTHDSPWLSLLYGVPEPLRILKRAESWEGTRQGKLLLRRQGVEWWRRRFCAAWDSWAVWDPSVSATAWVDVKASTGTEAWLRGWW